MLQSFAFSKSFQLCCWSKAPQKYGTGSGPSPNSTFTLTHTVKPELQEVVLHSILSGQTNYSPFWKMHLSSSSIYFSSPPLHQPCLLLLIYCFPCGSPERNGHRDGELGYLCYLRLSRHSGPKWAAVVAAQAPKFREIFSCGVPSRPVVFLPTVSPKRFCGIS